MTKGAAVAALLGAGVVVAAIVLARTRAVDDAAGEARCASGFISKGPRCLVPDAALRAGDCPPPLATTSTTNGGCDAPNTRVVVPATSLLLGPSDWEAQGQVVTRTISVSAFALDAFELTASKLSGMQTDGARAAAALTYAEAEAACKERGGRLPTEDEWIAAAAGARATRYPWGDTGAVCRRAAWGLAQGPCAWNGDGPDTVGAHPSGATSSGIHDLAGNVAEWTSSSPDAPVAAVRGGSWRTALASDLRTWSRRELPKSTRADDVGVRCAYDLVP